MKTNDKSPVDILSLTDDPRWIKLVELAAPYQDKRNDRGHSEIVTLWADSLLKETEEIVDKDVILTAALLHDVGWSRLSDDERMSLFSPSLTEDEAYNLRFKHEKEGVLLARDLLEKAGYGNDYVDRVCSIIDGHDTGKGFKSGEDGIVKDADKLWMVSNTGFEADLRRRKISPAAWGSILEEKFENKEYFYSSTASIRAIQRLSRLIKGKPVPPPGQLEKPKVLICHYRVGWTDGVSLEIEKRQSILEEMGFSCALLAGPGSKGADFLIEDLDFDTPEARMISRNAFGVMNEFNSEEELKRAMIDLSDRIEKEITTVLESYEPDFVLLHNIFSHGRHIAAARAFYQSLKKAEIPSLATHHDFYWERDDFKEPSGPMVENFLNQYVPPVIPGMRHAVINSLAARSLLTRCGIDGMIFPDTLDFSVEQWKKDEYNHHILKDFDLREEDILILQATRIVRRKGIELIPPLIKKLNSPAMLNQLVGRKLYNGKTVTEQSRFVFLLAGYAEQEAEPYRQDLEELMNAEGVPYRFLRSRIAVERSMRGNKRVYSLFDTYPYADLVSYPSIYEGWGNQFIEAVFAHKPVIVHEYPVFQSDILPKGYSIISLGDGAVRGEAGLYSLEDEALEEACHTIVEWLLSEQTGHMLEENFNLARSNNSYDYLRALMRQSMEHYENF